MTPLASEIYRIAIGPKEKWPELDKVGVVPDILNPELRCFEVSEVRSLISELSEMMRSRSRMDNEELLGTSFFAPFNYTWIELCSHPYRCGYFIGPSAKIFDARYDDNDVLVRLVIRQDTEDICFSPGCAVARQNSAYLSGVEWDPETKELRAISDDEFHDKPDDDIKFFTQELMPMIWSACILINSPRIVRQVTRAPERAFRRELKRMGQEGELRPWHQIKLEVTKPRDIDDGEPHRGQLSGKRALHFVRKFIRIRFNKLEYVRPHWRGNAEMGITRADYVVKP